MRDHESEEMYLETILRLKSKKAFVRSVDIVEAFGYAKSSVSNAVGKLVAKGYITVDRNGGIDLTRTGSEKANAIYERHRVITALLIEIGADATSAEENACRIEHVITDDVFEKIKQHIENK